MSQVVINIAKNGYTVGSNTNGGYMSSSSIEPSVHVATTIDEALGYVREELEATKNTIAATHGIFGSINPLAALADVLGVPVEGLQKMLRSKIGGLDPKDPFDLGDLHTDNDKP